MTPLGAPQCSNPALNVTKPPNRQEAHSLGVVWEEVAQPDAAGDRSWPSKVCIAIRQASRQRAATLEKLSDG